MKLDTFFDNFGLLADAPNGFWILRQMILQLAVQGKLVPQDRKDEPAIELYKKLNNGLKQWVKEKKAKAFKINNHVIINNVKIPSGWHRCYLGEICSISYGKGLPTKKLTSKGYPVFGANGVIGFYSNYLFEDRMLLISCRGAYSGKVNISPPKAFITNNSLVLRFACQEELLREYLYYALQVVDKGRLVTGSAQPQVTINNCVALPINLPPIGEQKRILAKVDELMALCDELEARKQQVSINCIKLNDASVHKLLTAREPKKFSKHWQRICDNFDLLYSKPENVNKLRQAILQLAVQGKLVPQDPKDEPASILLEKIKAEKERLVKEKKIKKPKRFPPIDFSDVPYKLPNGWEWIKLEQIRKTVEYGTSSKASPNDIGIPILRMNNIQNGKIFYDNLKYVKKDIKDLPRLLLKKNNILFNRTNSYELVGKTALYTHDDDLCTFASYLIRVSMFTNWVNPEYIANAMNSYYFRNTQIEPEVTQQCGQANFNGTKLANTLLPLPPLQEQKRIVAKVDELMVLCNELEAILIKSQMDCNRSMEAAVAEILAA